MVTQIQQGPFTYADYLLTPDDVRYELINGELIMAPAPTTPHQRVSRNFGAVLWPFVRDNNLGEIFYAPTDVYLSDTNLVQPDILFISAARAHIITETNIQGAPDLVIEIASPSTQDDDRIVKRELYERFGVLEYWMAYPLTQTVDALRLENGRFVDAGHYGCSETLTTPLLPGLRIDLSKVF
jgi:Uma2 family endonuclease